ncbi:DUF6651 domain-containing protein [Enterobacter hormaechei]
MSSARSYFGQNFKIEDGKVVAYDGQGNKAFSRHRSPASWPASDEALESLVESHPQKIILKSSGNSGVFSPVAASGRAENHETRCF